MTSLTVGLDSSRKGEISLGYYVDICCIFLVDDVVHVVEYHFDLRQW